jgi:hypothetical protein
LPSFLLSLSADFFELASSFPELCGQLLFLLQAFFPDFSLFILMGHFNDNLIVDALLRLLLQSLRSFAFIFDLLGQFGLDCFLVKIFQSFDLLLSQLW